jgi:hypothetical protein
VSSSASRLLGIYSKERHKMPVSTRTKTEEDTKNILEQKIKNVPDYPPYLEIEKGNYQYVYVKKSDFEYVSDFLGFLVYKNKHF